MKITRLPLPVAFILLVLLLWAFPAGAQVTINVLHSFPGADGGDPLASLTLSSDGTTLYGTTYRGGARDRGTIFQMAAGGGELTVIHSFGWAGVQNDGEKPSCSLTLSKDGTTLYGTTFGGGANNYGTIFSYNITTRAYAILHAFPGEFGDGMGPRGRLTLSKDGNTLYGTTVSGGWYNNGYYGTVFSYNITTGTVTVLHAFDFSEGWYPQDNLTLSDDGTTLYGTVQYGWDGQGNAHAGAIFKIGTEGGTLTYLRAFSESDGAFPQGLTLSSDGTTLYGVTNPGQGGWPGNGTLFKIDTAGTGFSVLYAFGGSDGKYPQGSLTLSGDGTTLYGMTTSGGAHDGGAIFSYRIATNAYSLLHSFDKADDKGVFPFSAGSLTFSSDGAALYGMRRIGGVTNAGALFKMDTAGAAFTVLHSFGTGPDEGRGPSGNLTLSGDGTTLYGMTSSGGAHGQGTLFRMAAQGAAPVVLHAFGDPGVSGDGQGPYGSLTLARNGSTLYGMTNRGGAHGQGALFSYDTATGAYAILHAFGDPGVSGDGQGPFGSLTLASDGTTLYGMTPSGGVNGQGVLFSYDTATGAYAILHAFGDPGVSGDGQGPYGSLTLSRNGSTLYGLTIGGGANGKGALFSYNTLTTAYTILHAFGDDGVSGDGQAPYDSLTLSKYGTTLYGMTYIGGASGMGAIFSYNTLTTAYTILHSFMVNLNDGAYPFGSLTLTGDGATLWGMTCVNGVHGAGTLFNLDKGGAAFTLLHSFGDDGVSVDGQYPRGSLTLSSDGTTLYGMTLYGGAHRGGAIFSVTGAIRLLSFTDILTKTLKIMTNQPVDSSWEADRTEDRSVGMGDAILSIQESAGLR